MKKNICLLIISIITYLIFKFNDEHKNGSEKTSNPDFWLGNIEYWDKILSKIELNSNI